MNITDNFGYLGLFLITMLEYACLPLPSEVILPFIGFGIANGKYKGFARIYVVATQIVAYTDNKIDDDS